MRVFVSVYYVRIPMLILQEVISVLFNKYHVLRISEFIFETSNYDDSEHLNMRCITKIPYPKKQG